MKVAWASWIGTVAPEDVFARVDGGAGAAREFRQRVMACPTPVASYHYHYAINNYH
jgi:hypothetical protein